MITNQQVSRICGSALKEAEKYVSLAHTANLIKLGIYEGVLFQILEKKEKDLSFPIGLNADPEGKKILYLTAKEGDLNKIKFLTPKEYYQLTSGNIKNILKFPSTYVIDIDKLRGNNSKEPKLSLEERCREIINKEESFIRGYQTPDYFGEPENAHEENILLNIEEAIVTDLFHNLPPNPVYAGTTFQGAYNLALENILNQEARQLKKEKIKRFFGIK